MIVNNLRYFKIKIPSNPYNVVRLITSNCVVLYYW